MDLKEDVSLISQDKKTSNTLYSIDNNYDNRFNTYKKNCNQDEVSAEIFHKILTDLSKRNWADKPEINFLDLGCGEGGLTKSIVEKIRNVFPASQIYVHAIDKSSFLINELQAKIIEMSDNNICINVQEDDIFEGANSIDKTFDIIMCSHVFYYSKDLKQDLMNIKSLLNSDGIFCIAYESERSDLKKLRAKYNTIMSSKKSSPSNIMENTLKELDFNYRKYPAKACLKFPENTLKFLQLDSWEVYDEKIFETAKNLLEFVLHDSLNILKDKKTRQDFIQEISQLLLKHNNCLSPDNDFFAVFADGIDNL